MCKCVHCSPTSPVSFGANWHASWPRFASIGPHFRNFRREQLASHVAPVGSLGLLDVLFLLINRTKPRMQPQDYRDASIADTCRKLLSSSLSGSFHCISECFGRGSPFLSASRACRKKVSADFSSSSSVPSKRSNSAVKASSRAALSL